MPITGARSTRIKPPIGAQIDYSHSITRGLIGAYLFNAGSGSVAIDSSLCRNHGTIVKTAMWALTPYGWGMQLDAADGDYITLDRPFGITRDFSLLWGARCDNTANVKFVLDNRDAASDGFYVSFAANETLSVQLNATAVATTSAVQHGSWHNYGITYDGANVRYYEDGGLMETDAVAETFNVAIQPRIGSRSFMSPSVHSDMDLSYMYIWNSWQSGCNVKRISRDPFSLFSWGLPDAFTLAARGGKHGPRYDDILTGDLGYARGGPSSG